MITKRRLIEEGWNLYRTKVIPADAPAVQIVECRRAFYAGAHQLFTSIMHALEPGNEATDADLTLMLDIEAEAHEFAKLVQDGVA